MSPLTHFTTYAALLKLPLSMTQRLLLCLIVTFEDEGLKTSNDAIGKCLSVSGHTVKNALTELRRRDLIVTENERSRYRRIYPNKENLLSLLRSQVDSFYFPSTKSSRERLLSLSLGKLLSLQEGNRSKVSKKRDSLARTTRLGGDGNPRDNGELFGRFWTAYPKKVGKGAARKAFAKHQPDAELLGKILEALEWQGRLPQWRKEGGRFIPNPATWLNEERWEDEKPEQQRGDIDWLPTEEEAEKIMVEAGLC